MFYWFRQRPLNWLFRQCFNVLYITSVMPCVLLVQTTSSELAVQIMLQCTIYSKFSFSSSDNSSLMHTTGSDNATSGSTGSSDVQKCYYWFQSRPIPLTRKVRQSYYWFNWDIGLTNLFRTTILRWSKEKTRSVVCSLLRRRKNGAKKQLEEGGRDYRTRRFGTGNRRRISFAKGFAYLFVFSKSPKDFGRGTRGLFLGFSVNSVLAAQEEVKISLIF